MWLVTWEEKDSRKWASDPEPFFRTKKDAVKYMKDVADCLLPENQLVLYRCERSSNRRQRTDEA